MYTPSPESWTALKAVTALHQLLYIKLLKRRAKAHDDRLPLSRTVCDSTRASFQDPETGPTCDGNCWPWNVKKPSRFTSRRWRKSLRFSRVAAIILSFMWTFLPGYLCGPITGRDPYEESRSREWRDRYFMPRMIFISLLLAWDGFRILQSLYQQAPGFHYDYILFLELCIFGLCVTDRAIDLSYLGALSVQAYNAIWRLPAVLVSVCIAARHAWRYPSRRRERIRYATIKLQLAFTASGKPVAVYLPQDTYGLMDVSRLSIYSLQQDQYSQSNGSEHPRHGSHNFTGYQQA